VAILILGLSALARGGRAGSWEWSFAVGTSCSCVLGLGWGNRGQTLSPSTPGVYKEEGDDPIGSDCSLPCRLPPGQAMPDLGNSFSEQGDQA
jgi:hypothetical protein